MTLFPVLYIDIRQPSMTLFPVLYIDIRQLSMTLFPVLYIDIRQPSMTLFPVLYIDIRVAVLCGRDDADNYQKLMAAMDILKFDHQEQETIKKILASVLHLGNIVFATVTIIPQALPGIIPPVRPTVLPSVQPVIPQAPMSQFNAVSPSSSFNSGFSALGMPNGNVTAQAHMNGTIQPEVESPWKVQFIKSNFEHRQQPEVKSPPPVAPKLNRTPSQAKATGAVTRTITRTSTADGPIPSTASPPL
ncbi:unconventional myosin-XV-like isoform X2 [Biomphalaria pfeifferi]|uniref:Unconventional myosin-XV-like isoform X2 n=1 Tax=Biomphalaria pfeifferi TaxID=112525 RepID=A0AAD8FE38_BIOPF|nr:unconventional myosin-XV-like isoform X2 [Biomphalaria pfeifferi]